MCILLKLLLFTIVVYIGYILGTVLVIEYTKTVLALLSVVFRLSTLYYSYIINLYAVAQYAAISIIVAHQNTSSPYYLQ